MFGISSKAVYGLTAMLELGMNLSRGPVQIRDLAEPHEIPQHYLEQLLVILKKAALVQSFRGSRGGYSLARHPGQIRVLEILSVLEGRPEVVSGAQRQGALGFFWKRLEDRLEETLDISLEELILARQHASGKLTYTI